MTDLDLNHYRVTAHALLLAMGVVRGALPTESIAVGSNDIIDILARDRYGKTVTDAHRQWVCVACGRDILLGPRGRRVELMQEWGATGLCLACAGLDA